MIGWFSELVLALQIFYAIALSTSLLLVVQLVAMLFGVDGDADADFAADGADAHDTGGSILSVRTVTAFFVGFGWTGVATLEDGRSLPFALTAAIAVGGLFMVGVFFLMRSLYGLRASGTLDYRNAIGQVGVVYLPIPGEMAGPGQVEVTVQGRLRVVQAFTRAQRKIPNRARIRVVDVMDQNTLVVEPLEQPAAAASEES